MFNQSENNITDVSTPLSDLRMLVPREAAQELGVSMTMLREIVASGELRFMPWGNERRIPRWELRRWQEQQLEKHSTGSKVFSILESINNSKQRYHGSKNHGETKKK